MQTPAFSGRFGPGDKIIYSGASALISSDEAGAVCQLRHLAGLDGQLAAGDLGLKNAVVFEVKVVDICHFVSSFDDCIIALTTA